MQKMLLFLCCLSAFALQANNLVISNVSLVNDSTLSFNLSWENSWRVSVAPNNHDAVWVFIKKRECASSIWSHVDLSGQSGAHSAGSPLRAKAFIIEWLFFSKKNNFDTNILKKATLSAKNKIKRSFFGSAWCFYLQNGTFKVFYF